MNIRNKMKSAAPLAVATAVSALLVACASTPSGPHASAAVRDKLTTLQNDRALAGKADVAMQEAQAAVLAAEMKEKDEALVTHRVYLADRKVESARALAEMRVAEEQQTALGDQRERARLDARTREADAARERARIAQAEGEAQRIAAEQARDAASLARQQADESRLQADESRMQADAARVQADQARVQAEQAQQQAQQQASDLRQQISDLEAKVTERGIVLTVGDMLFSSGNANLLGGTTGNLDKLATFLDAYPDRSVRIEGHTDSAGTAESNYLLSQRRADSVKSYLVGKGVGSPRLTTAGLGEDVPVADNNSAIGRQVNRRVEVIISNDAPAPK